MLSDTGQDALLGQWPWLCEQRISHKSNKEIVSPLHSYACGKKRAFEQREGTAAHDGMPTPSTTKHKK
jgi:hypothetical protein